MKPRTLTATGLSAAAVALTPVAVPATALAATTKTYKGALEYTQYGNVRVTITVSGKKIRSLSLNASPDSQESYNRQAYALPLLHKEALKAQSYKIHTISGVTITSEAFIYSLYAAMRHAHIV